MKFKNLILILIMAVFTVGFYSCNQKPAQTEEQENVKYYRNLLFSETSWDIERGSYPLSADEAKTINNYKFTWDDQGRLASIEYNRNGVLLGYSSMGAAKITYTYDGNIQLKHFFNENNEPSTWGGSVFTQEYTTDGNGLRIGLRFLDKDGNPVENWNNIHNYKWAKLSDGMIQEIRYNLAGESVVMNPFCPFYELRFSYDNNGFVTRMANYEADTLYNCTAENCGDVGVSYFLFDNNDKGDVKSFSVHSTTGQLSNLYWGWAKRISVFDENGYPVEVTQYDQDNELLGGNNLPITKSVYDEHGALVERISMDANKNIAENPNNGVAITAYKYDDQGRRIETLQYNKNRELVEENNS
ncbi:MAG: hypothetical protein JXR31_11790 [Prolixibacteraceae bacterium]|nr:hypothetical protein [Prolixibacteraceae bacterium]MBN2774926.1 hypothetical protein [Prolixibacteraceae bacterium]